MAMLSDSEYVTLLLTELEKVRDPVKADSMEAYMKNKFPFYGVNAPLRKNVVKDVVRKYKKPTLNQVDFIVRELWVSEYREAQYMAMDLLDRTRYYKNKDSIALFEWLILSKSHWDTVDLLASTHVGSYFKHHPKEKESMIKRWNASGNLWLVRTSIIFQLKYKTETNIALLEECIKPHLKDQEFFIQKAIGWALRQLSRTNPEAVKRIANNYPLSRLAQREGLKYV